MNARRPPKQAEPAPGDSPGVVAHPPIIYGGALAIGLGVDWLLSLPPLPLAAGQAGPVLAWALGLAGAALLLAAALRFIRAGTNIPTHLPATALVTDGLYRLSRNPIYLGLTLVYVGLVLGFASLASVVLLPAVLLVMQYGVIHREERYLEAKFGEAYLHYKSTVRRWL